MQFIAYRVVTTLLYVIGMLLQLFYIFRDIERHDKSGAWSNAVGVLAGLAMMVWTWLI